MENSLPAASPASVSRLKLLSGLHYVLAGLLLVALGLLALHYGRMQEMIEGTSGEIESEAWIELFLWWYWGVFRWAYLAFGLLGLLGMALNLVLAFDLRARRHRRRCLVLSAFNCLLVPVGTVLGVCTLALVNRPDLRQAFRD